MTRRLLALCACALALASCRVDVSVDVVVEPDGTGTITLTATADAELVAAVPTIADELATDDIVAAGWEIDGPTPTTEGGLTISLTHEFFSDAEATNLLNSLGPPFSDMAMERDTVGDDTTTRLDGRIGLPDGFESFADQALIDAIGGAPFEDQLDAAGATPESSMSAVIRVTLPGEIDADQTNGTRTHDGRLTWTVPLDGQLDDWAAQSTQSPGENRWWARPLSIVALVALIAWIAFMAWFIGYVVIARRRRSRRHAPRM